MTFWLFFHPHVYYWGKLYQKGANHQYTELCPLILQEVHNNLKTASQSNYQPQLSLHWFHPNPATGPPAAFCTSAPFSFAWLCNPPPPFLNNFASLWQRALHCNKQMISSSNLVTLLSALEYCLDVEKLNLSAIRTVRVLRPLRAINRIPSVLMI